MRTPQGMRYPADPPRVEEIVAVMRQADESIYGDRVRGLIVVLWRAGLRIQEALELAERDLDDRRGALLVRHGKGAGAARSACTTGAGNSFSQAFDHGGDLTTWSWALAATTVLTAIIVIGKAGPDRLSNRPRQYA